METFSSSSQLETLQASYEDLKAQSQEEIRLLWSQLESMKTNREELNGEDFCGMFDPSGLSCADWCVCVFVCLFVDFEVAYWNLLALYILFFFT